MMAAQELAVPRNCVALGDIPGLRAAERDGDSWAIRYGDDVISWGELERASTARARAFAAAGVRNGDMVTLAAPNSTAFFELIFALWKVGATPHVVSPYLPPHELAAIVDLARPKLVVGAIHEASSSRYRPITFGRDFPGSEALPSVVSQPWKAMSSGGSTGRPKIIVQPGPGIFDPTAGDLLNIPSGGTILTTGPLYHNMPVTTSVTALCQGSRVVGMARFDAEEALRLIEEWQISWASFVPTMLMRISRLPVAARDRHDLSSLRTLWHWASPMPASLKQEWIDRMGPDAIWEMYGGTEAIGTTVIGGRDWLRHPGSVGRPVSDQLRITDEVGQTADAGTVGEIFALPPGGQASTYRYIGAEARADPDGFETLGDYGWLDEEGFLYIADRRTDMIVSGGANIFPAEVENALMAHPSVEMAVVIGLPHDDLGAVVHAIVKPVTREAGALTGDVLTAFLADRLVRYKTPRSFEFTDAHLRDDAGKVRRQSLREARVRGCEEPA